MTSNIKLLPLPEWMSSFIVPDGGKEVGCDHRLSALMKDYALANVTHATAAKDAEIEALRAEVERLQKIVRPKREEECLTLDHWRMRAYDLEANWSRCSRACVGEQTKREAAEARAERLAEALRDLEPFAQHHDSCGDHDAYNNSPIQTCGCGLDSLLERIAALRDHDQEEK